MWFKRFRDLFAVAAVGLRVGVLGERGVVDRLAHLLLVRVVEQPQVVDAGGVDRGGRVGFDRGGVVNPFTSIWFRQRRA